MHPARLLAPLVVAGALIGALCPRSALATDHKGEATNIDPRELAKKGKAGDDLEPPFRLSLPTIADEKAWQEPGFRLQLGYAYGGAFGLQGTPDGTTHAAVVRVGARLDERWSLLATLIYAGAVSDRGKDFFHYGLNGLRFLGTLDPTWNVTDRLSVAVGMGFGGMVEGGFTRKDTRAQLNDEVVALYTPPDTETVLPSCNGVGAAALARVNFDVVLGPTSAIGLAAQVDSTWTRCEMNLGRVEPDTADDIVRRQYWGTWGANLGAIISWR